MPFVVYLAKPEKESIKCGISRCNLNKTKGPGLCYKTKILIPFLIIYCVAFNCKISVAVEAVPYKMFIALWTITF